MDSSRTDSSPDIRKIPICEVSMVTYSELYEHLEFNVECDKTLRQTHIFCLQEGLDFEKVEKELNKHGGYCDCEVIFNCRGRLKGSKKMPQEKK